MLFPTLTGIPHGNLSNGGASAHRGPTARNTHLQGSALLQRTRAPVKWAQSSNRRPPDTRSVTCPPPPMKSRATHPMKRQATPTVKRPLLKKQGPSPVNCKGQPSLVLLGGFPVGKEDPSRGGTGTTNSLVQGVGSMDGILHNPSPPSPSVHHVSSGEFVYNLMGLVTVFFGWIPSEVTEGVMVSRNECIVCV